MNKRSTGFHYATKQPKHTRAAEKLVAARDKEIAEKLALVERLRALAQRAQRDKPET